MTRKTILCNSCDASYTLSFDMDDDLYKSNFCPFCGEELVEDDYNIDEDEDIED